MCSFFSKYFEKSGNIYAFFLHLLKYMEELMHFYWTFSKYLEHYAFLMDHLEYLVKIQEKFIKNFKNMVKIHTHLSSSANVP